ncbi:MAG: tRNA preQ1(34) S-adenosylmethionine ribosyltransferase-isomerase QueA [Aestuariivirgaceae bacterium]|nr:tRNA preQ1(34) S-adenosylmethionine ribosyltransferase-isomerase QueA [Aestuariivirgaceae bacterium]
MRVDEFDFELPPENIALRPAVPRDSARLLLVEPGKALSDHTVAALPDLLEPGDVLVFNDTKVIPAALEGVRLGRHGTTPKISLLLHQRVDASRWKAFAKPAKKLEAGDLIRFGAEGRVCLAGELEARVEEKGEAGEITLNFAFSGPVLDEAIATLGSMPLPPYIAGKRAQDEQDRRDYQTIYARAEGAVAAPTAGLHFTPELLEKLREKGIGSAFVTLHVGAGTFLPVKADDTADHRMHSEWGEVSAQTVAQLKAARRVIAVGTTSFRLLESAARETGTLAPFSGSTDIFITPGFRFKAVDALMTNFHLPKSTLFMLVSAFAGLETMKQAYEHAIQTGYRFYSYGDASLLLPAHHD